MSDTKTIQWMHPSWRDLAIERLSADAGARITFLTTCGINGFMLALSAAGGEKGERQTPLVVAVEDWSALGETGKRLILTGAPYDDWRLLQAVLQAISHQPRREGNLPGIAEGPEAEFARVVLRACAEKWNSHGNALTSAVSNYFAISERLSPLPPCPNLWPMWDISWTASTEEMESFDSSGDEFSLSETDDWLQLAALILENEPRFLKQVDFPAAYTPLLRQFLPSLMERARLDLELRSKHACEEEDDRLDFLSGLIGMIARLFSDLENEVADMSGAIEEGKGHVECERDRIEEEEAEEKAAREERDWMWPRNETKSTTPLEPALLGSPASRVVDLQQLFEDL